MKTRRQGTRRSSKSGQPETYMYIGTRSGEIAVEMASYDANAFRPLDAAATPVGLESPWEGNLWINVDGVHDPAKVESICRAFGIHPLTIEDIMNTEQRPKLEDYDDYLFIVMKMLRYDEATLTVESEQVSLILGARFTLCFQEGAAGDVFEPVRRHLRSPKSRVRQSGADFLCYALIDAVVDQYFFILEELGERIESIEDELVANPTRESLQTIHQLKRELVHLRKSVWPLREVIGAMQRDESALIADTTAVYLRDVYDHTIQVIDTIESYRDMLAGMLDIYMSSVSNRMNEVMKVLTIIATVFIPLTFIAGVYGMNFDFMPELHVWWTYPALWGMMLAISAVMLAVFKKKNWW